MLEFQKRELKFKYDGEEHTVRFPSVKDYREFREKYKDAEGDKALDGVVEFLSRLGLNREIADSLEPEYLEIIMDEITSKKKS